MIEAALSFFKLDAPIANAFVSLENTLQKFEQPLGDISPTLLVEASDGSKLYVEYLTDTQEIVFNTRLREGTYLAMGFGKDMVQTEMVQWGATKTFSSKVDPTGFLKTYYSSGHRTPLEDNIFVNCYEFDVLIDQDDRGFV